MSRLLQGIIRSSAFLRKEVFEILRQPRLVFTLVLGPFLILLIFGIGYTNEPRSLRTLFVADRESPLGQQIDDFASSLGPQLVFMGVTEDATGALSRLQEGEVDLVAVAPPDAYEKIRNSEQAVFTLYHGEIDPFQVEYVGYFGQVYTDEVNRRILQEVMAQGQRDASTLQEDLSAARSSASAARAALEADDQVAARQHQRDLDENIDNVSLVVGASLGVLSSVQRTTSPEGADEAGEILGLLSTIRQDMNELQMGRGEDNNTRLQRVISIEQNLTALEESLVEFHSIHPAVLVSPFRGETQGVTVQLEPADFFAPAVLALLLQHLAITFAALSIVRERSVGTTELFRVSPLSAGEALLGKFVSYMIFGGVIGAILSVLIFFILQVPMLGNWWYFVGVMSALLFTSLAIGFVISLTSQTDSQAVQSTMIVLLTSVFFSGFLMALDTLTPAVRVVSWALPVTYGIVLLRDIAFRSIQPDLILLTGLITIGIVLTLLAWIMLRRLISQPRQ